MVDIDKEMEEIRQFFMQQYRATRSKLQEMEVING